MIANKRIIFIRYGELTLKGKNRGDFTKCLFRNIRFALKQFPKIHILNEYDATEINGYIKTQETKIIEILKRVSGISLIIPATKTTKKWSSLTKAIITQCQTYQNHSFTFKVKAKRADKNYPLNSMEIAQRMGGEVLRQFSNFKVDVHQPQIEIIIEIRQSYALFYFNKIKGMGGFPLGINGRVLLLMSGGIDSPVAGYLLMKKGLHVDFLTFISPPHTDERALEKVRQLKNILTLNNKITLAKLFIVNFTKIQHEISHIANHSYQITIMRRYFIKIAMHLADKYHYDAIATGESLGQVASQTVESLTTIQNVVKDKMILRPLLTYDKNEIIALAKSINTYDTSILPYADACSLFVPAHPTTKPKIAVAQVLEDQLELLADIYHNTIAKYIKIE